MPQIPRAGPVPLTVVGAPELAARLGVSAGAPPAGSASGRRVVVVGGPVAERMTHAARAVGEGAHVFLLWPPGTAAGADALAGRAEEAGVEVGLARPLGARALAGVPDGWAARLVTLTLVARTGGTLAGAGWPGLLAGAVDLCSTLADARDASRLDAVAERDGDAIRAVALAGRFENGAYAQAVVRFSDHAPADEVALYAARPGSRVEARSLDGPLCVETQASTWRVPVPSGDPLADEVAAFVEAVGAGRPPAYGLGAALTALRLVARVRDQLR